MKNWIDYLRKYNVGTRDSNLTTKQERDGSDMSYIEKDKQITPETEVQEVYMALGEYKGRFDALAAYVTSSEYIYREVVAAILGVELPKKKKTDNEII